MRKKSIFWGIVLIGTAALIIFDAFGKSMGFLDINGLPVIRIILGILCLAWAVNAVYKKHFTGIFFPMAFIFLLFEGEIARLCGAKSDDLISTWAVLLCALLMTAGFAIIGPHKKKQAYKHNEEYNMGQFTRYIDCTDFTYHSVENNLGKCDIFFVNTENYTSGGTVSIYNNLGSTVIHVPSDWRPIVDIDNSLGSVSVPTQQEGICKILNIVGENNLGSINIKTV